MPQQSHCYTLQVSHSSPPGQQQLQRHSSAYRSYSPQAVAALKKSFSSGDSDYCVGGAVSSNGCERQVRRSLAWDDDSSLIATAAATTTATATSPAAATTPPARSVSLRARRIPRADVSVHATAAGTNALQRQPWNLDPGSAGMKAGPGIASETGAQASLIPRRATVGSGVLNAPLLHHPSPVSPVAESRRGLSVEDATAVQLTTQHSAGKATATSHFSIAAHAAAAAAGAATPSGQQAAGVGASKSSLAQRHAPQDVRASQRTTCKPLSAYRQAQPPGQLSSASAAALAAVDALLAEAVPGWTAPKIPTRYGSRI